MQIDVEIRGRAETLDERDGAGVGFGALESGLLDQKCGNDPVDDCLLTTRIEIPIV
jgi:hypothetical protein